MARSFVRASAQAIQITTGQMTNITGQMSFGCWFNPSSTPVAGNQHTFISKTNVGATPGRNYTFDYRTSGGGSTMMEFSCTPTSNNFGEWFWANTFTTGTWHHQFWTVDFSTNPITVALIVDGVTRTLSTAGTLTGTSGLTAATQQAAMGDSPAAGAAFNGSIAELFVTKDIMSANAASALSNGARTRELLAGRSIDLYVPLGITGAASEVDFSGNARTFTLTNSPAIANHAPVNMFTRPGEATLAPVVAGSFIPAWAVPSNRVPSGGYAT